MNVQLVGRVDPRIRRRRVQVRREEGRRRLRVLAGALTATAIIVAGWASTRSPLLDVDRIEVVGTPHTPQGEVLAASGVHRGGAMFDVDEEAAATGVGGLPWVGQVSVRRRWPGRVEVRVVERVPVVAVPAEGDLWALVDRGGRVLARAAARPDLPALAGVPVAGLPGSRLALPDGDLLEVAAALPADLRSRVAGVAPGPEGGVELRLQPEGTVRFGAADQLAEKFEAVATVLTQVDVRGLAILDVRIPSSPALTRGPLVDKVSTPRAG